MIILYHGSDFLFKRFVFKNVGKKSGTSGAGFGIYLTTNKRDACQYGKYCYTVQADLGRSISNEKKFLTKNDVKAILINFENIACNSYIENFEGLRPFNISNLDKAVQNLFTYNSTDVDIINDIINTTNCGVEMMEVLSKLGYTHTIDKKTPQDKTTINYIFYNLDCLKIQKREKMGDALLELYQSISEDLSDSEKMFLDLDNDKNDLNQMKTGNQGKSKSKSQRRLMAMALAYKRGELDKKYASDTIKKLANSITEESLHDFAATNQKKRKKDGSVSKRNNIPSYVKGSAYRPELKNSKTLKPKK